MTALLPDRSEVLEASEDDMRRAVEHAVGRAGFSFEELAAQAETGRFESVRARLAWVAIGDLKGKI